MRIIKGGRTDTDELTDKIIVKIEESAKDAVRVFGFEALTKSFDQFESTVKILEILDMASNEILSENKDMTAYQMKRFILSILGNNCEARKYAFSKIASMIKPQLPGYRDSKDGFMEQLFTNWSAGVDYAFNSFDSLDKDLKKLKGRILKDE